MKDKVKENTPKEEKHKKPSKKRKVIFGTLWVILWPIIVLFPVMGAFIGGLYVAQLILGGEQDVNENFISALQIAILVGVALLVIVLQLLKRYLKNRKRLFFRAGGKVLGVYVWAGIIIGGISMVGVGYSPSVADVVKPPAKQDKKLMRVVSAIGGDSEKLKDVSVSYVNDYKGGFEGQSGEYMPFTDQEGNFSHATITVKRGLNPEEEKVLVAHEYLHHIWETQIDPKTLHDLTSQLMTLYGKDDNFQNRVATYSDTNMLLPTELFAYYCTESSNQYLSQYVLSQCSKYINRNVLQFAR